MLGEGQTLQVIGRFQGPQKSCGWEKGNRQQFLALQGQIGASLGLWGPFGFGDVVL